MTWSLAIPALMTHLLVGCLAPGSELTRSSIRGKLLDSRGKPVMNQRVEVTLSGDYGLEGLDRVMRKPEDVEDRTERAVLRTDSYGEFSHLFEIRTRSITYFILPPIGAVPPQPPMPVFRIVTPGGDYFAGWNGARFDYRLASLDKRRRRHEGKVSGCYVSRKFPRPPYKDVDGWEAVVEIRE